VHCALAAVLVPASGATALTIYSSLPLRGDDRPQTRSVVDAARLALEQAGGRAGPFPVAYVSLNNAARSTQRWDPILVSRNARRAADDPTTIAYLGEFHSRASRLSIPILGNDRVLQVSPSNTYVGLTRAEGADRGEPEKYYPSGHRTYGRIIPADHTQASALVTLMRREGVRRLYVAGDGEVYGQGLAEMVARRAKRRGVRVVRLERVQRRGSIGALARRVRRSRANGFFFGGITQNRAADIFDAVARAARGPKLFGPDGVAESAFTRDLARRTRLRVHITTPTLEPDQYGRAARQFYADFHARYGRSPQPYAIYGYEAMRVVLDAITRAGVAGDNRQAVVDAFFATRDRASVLGTYSIDSRGDTTLGRYGTLRVNPSGRLLFDRVVRAPA
jgi:branched-chain amino acid transport system substrate-binding protein